MTNYYSRKIEMPKTKREGLENFLQIIINRLEAGETHEGLLAAVDLLQDVHSGVYDDAMKDAKGADLLAKELAEKHTADVIKASEENYSRGVADERARIVKLLGL